MRSEGTSFTAVYLQEAAEQLNLVEDILLEAEANPSDREVVNKLFRVFHTIKGSGSMFGFDHVASFTHHIETVLEHVRNGQLQLQGALVDSILACKDHITRLLSAELPLSAELEAKQRQILERLDQASLSDLVKAVPHESAQSAKMSVIEEARANVVHRYRIEIAGCEALFKRGLDPAVLLEDLRLLGECHVSALTEKVPPLELLAPEECHLAWTVELLTAADQNAIRDVFIFVEGDIHYSCTDLGAVESTASPDQDAALRPAAPVKAQPTVEASMTSGSGTENAPSIVKSAANQDLVRVPAWRLNQLVGVVGELVINRSRIAQISSRVAMPEFTEAVEDLERLVNELRDHVLDIRMMPIGSTFNRFKRLVRDLSAELGREIDLITEGAETELDKTVLDKLGESLVHVIRNAVDHGILSPDERAREGKPRRGTIRLSASHEGPHVVIRIEDDGRGIDPEKVKAAAIGRGYLPPEANPSQAELLNMVFLPGFSTATEITSISGRGVGMDVVKRQIDALRGSVVLSSVKGQGTRVTFTLPLTLAIIDGLVVEVAGDCFIIPLSSVMENVELSDAQSATGNGRNLISVRDELVPYLCLRELFGFSKERPPLERIVIVQDGASRIGLAVDRIHGTHQTVIQSLGRFYDSIPLISGATIMGDGKVALILDVAGLIGHAEHAAYAEGVNP